MILSLLPGLSAASRVMILAPHPDDEALGTGGLIQQVVAAGAQLKVVLITDGDNNPWPQRYLERRWFIDAAGRRRWGELRRTEALRSLEVLGLGPAQAVFLGFPDTGMLPLWHRRDPAVLAAFSQLFSGWPPDLLIVPSARDRHPDHRGVFAIAAEALRRTGQTPARFSYLIHRGWFRPPAIGVTLPLTAAQQVKKLQAILCHDTQMKLSRRRFTAYARPQEIFIPKPASPSAP